MCTPRGSGCEGRWSLPGMAKRVYNLQNKQLIKLYSQVCVLPGEWGWGYGHYLGWSRECIIYRSNCTVRYVYSQGSGGGGRWSLPGMAKRVYNLQIKLYSQVCVLPGEWGWWEMVTTWDGQESVHIIYRSNCTVRYMTV